MGDGPLAEVLTTVKSSGGDYTSLSSWESGEQTDLVTATDTHVVECSALAGVDTTEVNLTGWTTDEDYFITIRGASGSKSTDTWQAASSAYTIGGTLAGSPALTVAQEATVVERIQVYRDNTNPGPGLQSTALKFRLNGVFIKQEGDYYGFSSDTTGGAVDTDHAVLTSCIFWSTLAAYSALLVQWSEASSYTPRMYWCDAYVDGASATGNTYQRSSGSGAAYFHMCTGWHDGVSGSNHFGHGTDYNCAGDDTSAGDARGDSEVLADHFSNIASGDFGWTGYNETTNNVGNTFYADFYHYAYDPAGHTPEPWDYTINGDQRSTMIHQGISASGAPDPTVVTDTLKTSGGDYTSLISWSSGESRNLVDNHEVAKVVCDAMLDSNTRIRFDTDWPAAEVDSQRYCWIVGAEGVVGSAKSTDTNTYQYRSTDYQCFYGVYAMVMDRIQLRSQSAMPVVNAVAARRFDARDCYFGCGTTASALDIGNTNPLSLYACHPHTFINCVIHNRDAGSNDETIDSGAIYAGYEPVYIHCTIANTLSSSPKPCIDNGDSAQKIYLYNCILWNADPASPPDVLSNSGGGGFEGNGNAYTADAAGLVPGTSTVDLGDTQDPFVLASYSYTLADYNLSSTPSDWSNFYGIGSAVAGYDLSKDINGDDRDGIYTPGAANADAPTETSATIESSGGDYSTFASWESGEQKDLVAAWETHTGEFYSFKDQSTALQQVGGWTKDMNCRLKLEGQGTVSAVWDATTPQTYTLERTAGAGAVLRVYSEYVDVSNFQILHTGSTSYQSGVEWYGSTVEGLKHNIYVFLDGTVASYWGMFWDSNYGSVGSGITLSNCMVHCNGTRYNTSAALFWLDADTTDLAPCNMYHCGGFASQEDVSTNAYGYRAVVSGAQLNIFNCFQYGFNKSGYDYLYEDSPSSHNATFQSQANSGLGYNTATNEYGIVDTDEVDWIGPNDTNPNMTPEDGGQLFEEGIYLDTDTYPYYARCVTDAEGTTRSQTAPCIGPWENANQLVTGIIVQATAQALVGTAVAEDEVTGVIAQATAEALDSSIESLYIVVGGIPRATFQALLPTELILNGWDPSDPVTDPWSDESEDTDPWTSVPTQTDVWSDE